MSVCIREGDRQRDRDKWDKGVRRKGKKETKGETGKREGTGRDKRRIRMITTERQTD